MHLSHSLQLSGENTYFYQAAATLFDTKIPVWVAVCSKELSDITELQKGQMYPKVK